MALLYDKSRKKAVNVADNLVNEALQSGNYEFRSGVRVPVIAPDGQEGTVLSDELPNLVPQGFKYLTREEEKQRVASKVEAIKKEAYDSPVTAFAAGTLRGATLGLSDVAAVGIGEAAKGLGISPGLDTQEALRETQARSPNASLAGEVVGGIGALVGTGGATAIVGAPTRLAIKAGEKAAAKVGTNVFARAGAAGVTEGALLGVGQTVSEAALGDPELTVQKALGNVGMGALFGGGLNLVGRGALEGANLAITKGLKALSESEIVPKTAKELGGRLSEIYGKGASLVRGDFTVPEEGKKLWDRMNADGRKASLEHMADPQKLYRNIASNFDTVRQFSDELEVATGKAAKIQKEIIDENIGKISPQKIEALDDEMAAEFGAEFIATRPTIAGKTLADAEKKLGVEKFDAAWSKARKIVADMDQMRTAMKETNAQYGTVIDPGSIAEINKITDDLSMTLQSSRKMSEISDAIVKAKAQIGETTAIFNKPKELMSSVELRTKEALLPLWKSLKEASVDTEIFGDLGAALATRADALNVLRNGVQDFDKQFFTYTKDNKGRFQRIEDYSKIAQFFNNSQAASKEKKRLAMAGFENAVDETIDALKPIPLKNIQDEITNLQKVKSSIANKKQEPLKQQKIEFLEKKIGRLEEQNNKIAAFNDEIQATIQAAKDRKAIFDKSIDLAEDQRAAVLWLNAQESYTGKSLHGAILGGVLAPGLGTLSGQDSSNNVLFSGIGAVTGAVLGNPRAALKFIVGLENAAQGLDKMATNAAKKFKNFDAALEKTSGVRKGVTQGVKQAIIREKLRIEGDTEKDNEKAYDKHVKDLTKLQSDPVGLYEKVYDAIGEDGADVAPIATQAVFETAQRAVAFLDSKMPRDPYNQGLYPDKFTPSFAELDKYANYSRAVMKPKTLLKELESGNIKPETVEAVKAVYPLMYDSVVAAVSNELLEENKIGYDKRIQLGMLFEIPTVKALQPDYLQRIMGNYAATEQIENTPTDDSKMGRSQMVSFRNLKTSEREQRV
jgi:hypothetical protein